MSESNRKDVVPAGDPPSTEQPKPRHGDPDRHAQSSAEALAQRDSGQPGGGAGRRDDVGRTGVYPVSGDERPAGSADVRPLGDWAGGDRGIAGYEDSGGSELVMRDGILLGGTTSDGAGRPTIDIHTGDSTRETGRDERGMPPGDDERQDASESRDPDNAA